MDGTIALFAFAFLIAIIIVLIAIIRWAVGANKILGKLETVQRQVRAVEAKKDASSKDLEAIHAVQLETDVRVSGVHQDLQNMRENLYDLMQAVGHEPVASGQTTLDDR